MTKRARVSRPYGVPSTVPGEVEGERVPSLFLWHALPCLVAIAYFALVKLAPGFSRAVLSTEQGLIEVATAVLFAASAVVAGWIARDEHMPRRFRWLFVLFAIGAIFVALEETSYGQNFVGWKTPDWFLQHNVNSETNLHNLFHNKPSRRFQAAAVLAFPFACVAVPFLFRRLGGPYRPGEWRYYLLPGLELATIAILAAAVNWPNSLSESVSPPPWRGPELREVRELFWAWCALGYTLVIRSRL